MRRRHFTALTFTGAVWTLAGLAAGMARAATNQTGQESVKGKLIQQGDAPAVLQTDGGKPVRLSGDDDTQKVLHDPRLAGMNLEVLGHFAGPDQFTVGPSYDKNMFVLKDGKRLRITYWCDVCSIRTYAPGVCVCCQKWTDLDLRDPNQE
jgi:hypothetical protein